MPQNLYDRVRRASMQQKEAMIQFMEMNPEIGNERLASHYDMYYRKEKWYEITKILNKLPGKPKTPGKWQKAWQDWRYNTRKKFQTNGKLSNIEERLINISNNETIPAPDYRDVITSIKQTEFSKKIREVEENFEQNAWTHAPEISPEIEIKSEPYDPQECIGDMLETRIIEYLPEENSEISKYQPTYPSQQEHFADLKINQIKSLSSPRKIKKKYVYYDRNNVREIHKIARCVEKSVNTVKFMCKTHSRTAKQMVTLLQDNSRILQSLAESQMRQAEALERQVSLEESRNSILKQMALSLASLKNN